MAKQYKHRPRDNLRNDMKTRSVRYKQSSNAEDYLNQRIIKGEGCWEWQKGVDKNGYGQCQSARCAKELKVSRAHQLAYRTWVGQPPKGWLICHHCDNPRCCNPDHLYAGTYKSNMEDCINRGRYKQGGKPLTDKAQYIISQHGLKSCMELSNELNLSYSHICKIWRDKGLKGNNHAGVMRDSLGRKV